MTISLNNDRKGCLLAAMEDQGGQCFWCRCTLVILDDAKVRQGFSSAGHDHVTVITDTGHSELLYIASADHLVPQSMGGWTDRDNIVASCKQCNEDRGEMHNKFKWYVIDATGFEQWRIKACQERTRRALTRKSQKRLTASLRPAMEQALGRPKVIKLVKRTG